MKRILTTTLQIAVTVALLWWIFHDPAKRARMAHALEEADLWWYLPGLACVGGVVLFQTQRWFLLLRALEIPIGWLRCLRLLLIGMFFNLFLFGATGGDVVKIFYAMRESAQDKAGAFLSIALDRVLGLLALALVSAVVVVLQWHELARSPLAQGFVATIALILGGSVAVIVLAASVAVLRLENRLPARMPLRRAIVDLAVATQRYAKAPGTLIAAFLLSIPSHLLLFSSFYFAARAVTAHLSFANVMSVMPIVNVITSLPISLSGVGVREQLFQNLLGQLHGTPEALAVLIGMGGYLIGVMWSLVGGVLYLFYRPSDGHAATLKEMTAAAEEVAEHPAS
jgi:uncharacterized protein (TIRG00374 family)